MIFVDKGRDVRVEQIFRFIKLITPVTVSRLIFALICKFFSLKRNIDLFSEYLYFSDLSEKQKL